jgi:isopenicillin N synthase-like dioxygenase
MTKYFIINVAKDSEIKALPTNTALLQAAATSLQESFNYSIDKEGNITLTRQQQDVMSYDLEDAKKELKKESSHYQWLVEFNENTNRVVAMYDPYFSLSSSGVFYKVDVESLVLRNKKYASNEIEPKIFFDSLAYGIFKNISNNHPALPEYYQRGLALQDYLYQHPPKQSYGIIKKDTDTKKLAHLYLRKKSPLTSLENKKLIPNEKKIDELVSIITAAPAVPQINYDDFVVEDMLDILRNYGSFELVGPTIERFRNAAEAMMKKSKEVFALPLDILEAVGYEDFNGFQDFRKRLRPNEPVRNQIGYHYKPYKEPHRIPKGVENLKEFDEYYEQGMAILRSLYRKIAITLKMDPARISPFTRDILSALSIRKYFDDSKGDTGIPEHSDIGLLTLVFSDAKGLEIKKGENWIPAAHTPGWRFYVNIGDWFLLQLAESMRTTYRPGIHRVPQGQLKHSVVLFMNPDNDERVTVNNEVKSFSVYARTRRSG